MIFNNAHKLAQNHWWNLLFFTTNGQLKSLYHNLLSEIPEYEKINSKLHTTIFQGFIRNLNDTENYLINIELSHNSISEVLENINKFRQNNSSINIYFILWIKENEMESIDPNIWFNVDDIRPLNSFYINNPYPFVKGIIQKLNTPLSGINQNLSKDEGYPLSANNDEESKAWELVEQQKKEIEQRNYELEKAFKKSSIHHIKLQKILNQSEQQRHELEKALHEIQRKNEELATQNEEISAQRDQIELQNEEIQAQRDMALKQQDEINDNLLYASRIQQALLPPKYLMAQLLPEHFVFNKPKDIVSGDFYWVSQNRYKTIVAVADCTGHGISGAMMSMLGTGFLNEIINRNDITNSAQILEQLRDRIIVSLHQENNSSSLEFSRDGMDISLCIIDILDNTLEFSGTNNPLYLLRNGELQEYKADKIPIGIHEFCNEPYSTQKMDLQIGDEIYLFTDGFADQFGGKNLKKMKYSRFKQILLETQPIPFDQKEWALTEAFNNWKGTQEQIDDVLVIGFRIF